jgi:hypothetical protein
LVHGGRVAEVHGEQLRWLPVTARSQTAWAYRKRGVKTGPRGQIVTDGYLRTDNERILAGDVTGGPNWCTWPRHTAPWRPKAP